MSRLITLLTALILIATLNAYSQCTPDTTMSGLTQPTEAQGLNTAVANNIYNEVIHIHIPEDTIVPPLSVPIPVDSASLKNVQNLPSSFTYAPNEADHTWLGGEYGCVQIVGTPTMSDTGYYNITVTITVYSGGDSISDDLFFDFNIVDSLPISTLDISGVSNLNIFPNPANNKAHIRFYSETNKNMELTIVNVYGGIVLKDYIEAKAGNNNHSIDIQNLSAGVYFYNIIEGDKRVCKKLIIE